MSVAVLSSTGRDGPPSAIWSPEFKTYKSILFVSTRHEPHADSLTSQPRTHTRDGDGEVVGSGRPGQIKYAKSRHPFYTILQIVTSSSVVHKDK